MLIEVGEFETAGDRGEALLARVKSDIAALGGAARYAPGMKVGFTGDVAISVEETSALMADLSFSSVVVTLLVITVIVAYYRWWKATLVLVPPLLLATAYAFAIASLPPLGIHELNSNTAFLGSIIVGNGVNFGIILLARYVEERRKGVRVEAALPIAIWGSRPGTMSAAFAAAASYASLALTDFQGFRQFGFIGGIGMILSWGVAYLLMPSLVKRLDRGGVWGGEEAQGRLMAPLARLVTRHSGAIAAAFAVVTIFAAVEVRALPSQALEYDFSKLRRADTWESGEGYWGKRMDELLGTYLTPTVILADTEEQARSVAARLRSACESEPLKSMIAQIRTADDVLPVDQEAKLAEADAIREDMTPKMRSLVDAPKKEQIDRLLDAEPAKARLADLPRPFTAAMREKDGSIGKAVLVYPRPTHALWEGPALAQFVDALREIAKTPGARPARVAGSLPLSADILDSIRRDGLKASLAALGGVIVVVLVVFRQGGTSAIVIASLVTGVLWLAAAMMLFGVRINFANFIAYPITFGIGVDYAVNVMSRYTQDDARDVSAAIRSTGGAVTLCSMTTIIGYSSLLMAENRALYLFGLVAVLGEVCCLSAAVVALPALLSWARGLRAKNAAA
jgi:predicted RND superfamily exporter protein